MAAKFKYCVGGGELVIKDLKAVNDTYREGEVICGPLTTDDTAGVKSAGAGVEASIIGVCNQDDTLPAAATLQSPGVTTASTGAVLTGTQAAGTLENLKVIINPDAVYAVEYDQSTPDTWGTVTDTTIPFPSAGTGWPNIGGGWAWSYNTGELDYIVSSSVGGGNTTLVTVTGTDTSSTTGIILQAPYQVIPITLTADALSIASQVGGDIGVAGTNAVNGVVLENRIESFSHGSEILDCVTHNQEQRYMTTNTAFADRAKAFAYVRFNSILAGA